MDGHSGESVFCGFFGSGCSCETCSEGLTTNSGSDGFASGLVSSCGFSAFGFLDNGNGFSGTGIDFCEATVSICGVWVIIVTPLIVNSEPIQPITPRYIIRMAVPINGANAEPKICSKPPVSDGFVADPRSP